MAPSNAVTVPPAAVAGSYTVKTPVSRNRADLAGDDDPHPVTDPVPGPLGRPPVHGDLPGTLRAAPPGHRVAGVGAVRVRYEVHPGVGGRRPHQGAVARHEEGRAAQGAPGRRHPGQRGEPAPQRLAGRRAASGGTHLHGHVRARGPLEPLAPRARDSVYSREPLTQATPISTARAGRMRAPVAEHGTHDGTEHEAFQCCGRG
ncbi:hypothetical protein [Streptomyces canarius]